MSIIVKLGLVGLAAGVGGLSDRSMQLQYGAPSQAAMKFPASRAWQAWSASAPPPLQAPAALSIEHLPVRRVHIDSFVAQVEIVTIPQGPVRVQASGNPDTLKEFHVRAVGDEVLIRLDSDEEEAWFPWNLFNMWSRDRKAQDLKNPHLRPARHALRHRRHDRLDQRQATSTHRCVSKVTR